MSYDEIRTKKIYLSGSEGEATATIENGEMTFEAVAPQKTITSIKVNHKYQTNEVNSIDDLVIGNAYHFSLERESIDAFISSGNINHFFVMNFFYINTFDFSDYNLSVEDFDLSSIIVDSYINFNVTFYEDYSGYFLFVLGTNNFIRIDSNEHFDEYTFTLEGDFILLNNTASFRDLVNFVSICENIPIESVEVTYSDGTTEITH